MKKKFFSFRRIIVPIAAVMVISMVFTACKKNDAVSTPIPASGLMVFNVAPDKQGIGVALSGNVLNNSPLGYTSFNGTYQNIYTGTREIEAFDFGDSVFAKSSFTFEDGIYYSLFVAGNNGVYQNIVVEDEIDSTASSDKAYIRYINAIPDSSAPVVSITAGGATISESGAPFTSVTPFTAVTGGEVKISVNNGGTIAAERTVTLENGKVYTALLLGVPGATDEDKKVQIRYITNGMVPATSDK